jgi:hypothetical protein
VLRFQALAGQHVAEKVYRRFEQVCLFSLQYDHFRAEDIQNGFEVLSVFLDVDRVNKDVIYEDFDEREVS